MPLGEVHEFVDFDEYHVTMRLVDTKRGQQAQSVTGGYGPGEGNEYYVATFEVAYVSGPTDREWGVIWSEFKIEADLRFEGSGMMKLDEGQLTTLLYPGGKDSGWICFSVPHGAHVTGIYYESWWPDTPQIWFAVQ